MGNTFLNHIPFIISDTASIYTTAWLGYEDRYYMIHTQNFIIFIGRASYSVGTSGGDYMSADTTTVITSDMIDLQYDNRYNSNNASLTLRNVTRSGFDIYIKESANREPIFFVVEIGY